MKSFNTFEVYAFTFTDEEEDVVFRSETDSPVAEIIVEMLKRPWCRNIYRGTDGAKLILEVDVDEAMRANKNRPVHVAVRRCVREAEDIITQAICYYSAVRGGKMSKKLRKTESIKLGAGGKIITSIMMPDLLLIEGVKKKAGPSMGWFFDIKFKDRLWVAFEFKLKREAEAERARFIEFWEKWR